MAPGDISPYFDSKVTCQGLATTGAQAKYQDYFCGNDNHGNRERLKRDLGVEDETSPEGSDVLRRHQAWYNDKKRKERGGNLRFKEIAQRKLDENNWPDEEEEEEEEEEVGQGQGMEQDDEGIGGGGGLGEDDEEDLAFGLIEGDDANLGAGLGGGDEGQEEGDDVPVAYNNAEAAGVGVAAAEQGLTDRTGTSIVAIAAMRAHTSISKDVTAKNIEAGRQAADRIDRTFEIYMSRNSSSSPGIIATCAAAAKRTLSLASTVALLILATSCMWEQRNDLVERLIRLSIISPLKPHLCNAAYGWPIIRAALQLGDTIPPGCEGLMSTTEESDATYLSISASSVSAPSAFGGMTPSEIEGLFDVSASPPPSISSLETDEAVVQDENIASDADMSFPTKDVYTSATNNTSLGSNSTSSVTALSSNSTLISATDNPTPEAPRVDSNTDDEDKMANGTAVAPNSGSPLDTGSISPQSVGRFPDDASITPPAENDGKGEDTTTPVASSEHDKATRTNNTTLSPLETSGADQKADEEDETIEPTSGTVDANSPATERNGINSVVATSSNNTLNSATSSGGNSPCPNSTLLGKSSDYEQSLCILDPAVCGLVVYGPIPNDTVVRPLCDADPSSCSLVPYNTTVVRPLCDADLSACSLVVYNATVVRPLCDADPSACSLVVYNATDYHGIKSSAGAPIYTPTTKPVCPMAATSSANTICLLVNITSETAMEIETPGFPFLVKTNDCITVSIHYKGVNDTFWTPMCLQHNLGGKFPGPTVVDPTYCPMVPNVPGETVQFLVLTEPSNKCAPIERGLQHDTTGLRATYIYSESDCSKSDLSGIPGIPAFNRPTTVPLKSLKPLDIPVPEKPDVHDKKEELDCLMMCNFPPENYLDHPCLWACADLHLSDQQPASSTKVRADQGEEPLDHAMPTKIDDIAGKSGNDISDDPKVSKEGHLLVFDDVDNESV